MIRRMFQDALALSLPTLVYWLSMALGFGLFVVLVLVDDPPQGEDLLVLGILAGTTFGGTAAGQLAAVLRLRTWVLAAGSLAIAVTSAIVFAQLLQTFGDPALWGLIALLTPIFAGCGLLSLRSSVWQSLSLFGPMAWFSACMLFAAQNLGEGSDRWFAGDKYAVWDLLTASLLLLAVGSAFLFLATRERHRLYRWMREPVTVRDPSVRRVGGSPLGAALAGCGTLAFAALAILALTVGTGLLAPYLWRTGPAESGGGTPNPTFEPDEPVEPGLGPSIPPELVEAAKQTAWSLFFAALLALLLLLALLVFGAPLRRSLALQLLRSPIAPSPTERVAASWRLVEVALADLGAARRPADSATALVRRALPLLPPGLNVEPLEEVAEIADRARYGLGLDPTDEARASRGAEMAYQAVWDALSEWARIRAIYRLSL